jgi:DNA-binding LacI/PurR family transcriptional regulator
MSSPIPQYMRIRQYVLNRMYHAEKQEMLPAEREMGELFKVSRKTVRKALSDLINEGYVISKARCGNFINPAKKYDHYKNFYHAKNIGMLISCGMNIRHSRHILLLLQGACQALAERLATIEFLNVSSQGNIYEQVIALKLDGLLWIPFNINGREALHKFNQSSLPVMPVVMAERDFVESGNCVYVEEKEGYCKAVEYLFSLGHKRILYVGANPENKKLLPDMTGFCQAHKRHGIKLIDKLIINESQTTEAEFEKLLKMRPLPFTAVLCRSIFCGMIYQAVSKRGMRIPEDFSLITEEDEWSLGLSLNPDRIRSPLQKMGYAAANSLMNLVDNKAKVPVRVKFDWEIVKGDSCRAIN